MAETQQHVDLVEVKPQDILAERQTGWAMFTKATAWGIAVVVVLLVLIKIFFG
jgi:hypothetical protein